MQRITVLPAVLLLLVPAVPAQACEPVTRVAARVETPSLHDDEAGGNADADDPAIWVHATDGHRTRVVATAKNGGLRVYDLAGREVQAFATPPGPGPGDKPGRFNNVDLVGDLAVVSDRGRDRLRFYRIDPRTARLTDVTAPDAPPVFSADQAEVNKQRTAYGLGAWRDRTGTYALVSRRGTPELGIFEIVDRGGAVTYRRVDRLTLPTTFRLPDGTDWTPCTGPGDGPQVEGTAVDAANGVAYLAQEIVGLWRVPVAHGRFAGQPVPVERTREYGVPATFDKAKDQCVVDYARDPGFGGRIAADVEGLTIGGRVLVVSSQGDDTFFTYDRWTNRPLGHFAVVDGPWTDGSQECDGAALTVTPLPGFPRGLLVVQDGMNTPGDGRPNTDFKFVDAGFLDAA